MTLSTDWPCPFRATPARADLPRHPIPGPDDRPSLAFSRRASSTGPAAPCQVSIAPGQASPRRPAQPSLAQPGRPDSPALARAGPSHTDAPSLVSPSRAAPTGLIPPGLRQVVSGRGLACPRRPAQPGLTQPCPADQPGQLRSHHADLPVASLAGPRRATPYRPAPSALDRPSPAVPVLATPTRPAGPRSAPSSPARQASPLLAQPCLPSPTSCDTPNPPGPGPSPPTCLAACAPEPPRV